MAEATAMRNNALPYPVYGAPFTVVFPMLDADGDLVTGASTPDAEVSKNGDTFADATNESTEIATNSGMYYLTLTGTELTADVVAVIAKSATTGMKTTPLVLYPRKLVSLRSGTAAGGAAGYITLDAAAGAVDDLWNGCLVVATIDGNVEARIISDYTGSNQQAAVTPEWNVVPDSDDTFVIYLPEGRQMPSVNLVNIAGAAVSTSTAQLGVNAVSIAANAITATAINADAITAAKIADNAIDFATFAADCKTGSGLKANVESISAGAVTAAAVATNAIDADALAADAVAEIADAVWDELRAGHVGAGTFGEGVGSVQGNLTGSVGSVASGGITAASLATGAITNAKFASGAIDAAAIAGDAITAAKIANGAIDAATFAADVDAEVAGYVWNAVRASYATPDTFGDVDTAADIADAVADEVVTSGHAVAGSIGKLLGDNLNAPVATVDTVVDAIKVKTDYLPSATAGQAGGVFIAGANAATTVNLTGNLSGSVGSVTGAVGSVTGAVGSVASGGIAAASFAAGAINAAAIASGAITNAKFAAGAIDNTALADNAISATKLATGAITAGTIAADAIGASELAADAVAEIAAGLLDHTVTDHTTAGTVGKVLNDAGALGTPATAGEIADAVWDEVLHTAHETANSASVLLQAAGAAGDPWATTLPGSYGAGTAGKIVGDNLNAPVGTVDTVVDAIKLKTDNLPASPAAVGSQMDLVNAPNATAVTAIQNGLATASALSTVAGYIDTEVGAIKTQTDKLTFDAGNHLAVDVHEIDGVAASTHAAGMFPADVRDIAGAAVNTAAAQLGVNVVTQANIDFGALQKASLNAATPASVGAVTGNVAGNVGGNVLGSVGSVTGAVGGAVASVTAAVTVGTNNDKTGYALSAAGVDAILDDAIAEPAGVFSWASATLRNIVGTLGLLAKNKQTLNKDTGAAVLRNSGDTGTVGTRSDSDDGTSYVKGMWS